MLSVQKPAGLFYSGNLMTSPLTYLKHVREEFAHIVWPTSRKALAHTLVVIFIAFAIALLVGLLDYAFGSVVSRVAGG
jgi:preprotein translocase SecE subunit